MSIGEEHGALLAPGVGLFQADYGEGEDYLNQMIEDEKLDTRVQRLIINTNVNIK